MKGIVLSFGLPRKPRFSLHGLKGFFKRFGILVAFGAVLLAGMALGTFCAGIADDKTLYSLDFLFTTNLNARLDQGAVGTFCACFASDFIFLLCVYLFGLAAWGIPFLFLTICFKGFGTGLTAGYLCLSHSFSGAGFYLLVLLPGTFLFCAALIHFAARAFFCSKRVFGWFFNKTVPSYTLRQELFKYSSRFLPALVFAFLASLLDTLLWTLFAGTFQF